MPAEQLEDGHEDGADQSAGPADVVEHQAVDLTNVQPAVAATTSAPQPQPAAPPPSTPTPDAVAARARGIVDALVADLAERAGNDAIVEVDGASGYVELTGKFDLVAAVVRGIKAGII